MRFSKALIAVAAGVSMAAVAVAQDETEEQPQADQAQEQPTPAQAPRQPPEEGDPVPEEPVPADPVPPQPIEQVEGIEGLESTINALEDEPSETEDPPEAVPPSPGAGPAASPSAETDAPSAPAPPLTRAEQAEVQRLAERGRVLVSVARAGLIATRDMLSRVSDPGGAGISGWLAEPEGNAMAVTFYADGEEGPRTVYRADVLGGRVVSRAVHVNAPQRPALTQLQARMAAARAVASDQAHRPCAGDQFNYLVLPPLAATAPVQVYQVTPPTQPGRFPLGGHFRTTVGADGNVVETRGFTNACISIEAAPPAAGQRPQPIGVTHLLDRTATEVHMLLAALSGRPLLVATGEPQRIWLVTDDRIAEVRP